MSTPTSRTLDVLRGEGWLPAVVERWQAQSRRRLDLFGIIDIVALRGDVTLGVQATSYSNVSARVRKVADSPALPWLREAGWRLEVWGWHRLRGRWACRRVDVS